MKKRSKQKEILDDLSLDGAPLYNALKSLAWVNRYLGNNQTIIAAIMRTISGKRWDRPIRIVDLACSGGDVIIALAKQLDQKKQSYEILGIDGNPNALQFAADQTKSKANISYRQADILAPNFNITACDILISSHFVYHFSASGLTAFLKRVQPQVQTAIIFSELERNQWAFRLFKVFGPILPISKLANEDGLKAIQRAFTKQELLDIIEAAGVKKFSLKRRLFFRMEMVVYKSHKSKSRK